MIVPSMTHEEAYKELDADRPSLERWYDHRFMDMRRIALKRNRFPIEWWHEYVSPRHNHYIIFTKIRSRKTNNSNSVMVLALKREDRGYCVYMTSVSYPSIIRRIVCVQHVFDRYAERAHVGKTGIDLIKHIFSQQLCGYVVDDGKFAGRSVRYNGRDHQFMAIRDGILLGNNEDGIFIARTFITYDMATGRQKMEFEKAQRKIPDWREWWQIVESFNNRIEKNLIRKNDSNKTL